MDSRVMGLRAERWKGIITACNTSGMKKIDWMRIHNISPKNFYRWQKLLREQALEEEYGYPIMPGPIELSRKAQEERVTSKFADITAMVAHETVKLSQSSGITAPQKQLTPEIMIQAGSYNLYIGSGVNEATLATVLKVIGHA